VICKELRKRIENNESKKWYFKDKLVSDFHFEGDLLFGAKGIDTEVLI
jgi:hypothetical protein